MKPLTVVKGGVTFIDRDNIDTDQLVPNRFMTRVERNGFGEWLLYDWRRSGDFDLRPNPILVAGANFGCGSSREHAAWAIEDFGFRVVIAPSIGDTFATNAANVGVLPITLERELCRAMAEAGSAHIDLADQTIRAGGDRWSFAIDPDTKDRLLNGRDDIATTLQYSEAINEFEVRHDLRPLPSTTAL